MNIITLVLVLVVLVTSNCSAQKQTLNNFQLVKTWLPTFCASDLTDCRAVTEADFSMYGFWPADRLGAPITKCSNDTVSESVLDALEDYLSEWWPPIVSEMTPREYWKNEWLVYGTCSQKSATDYFQSAISGAQRINLKTVLRNAGITPAMHTSHKKADIMTAVQKKIGRDLNLYVTCKKAEDSNDLWLHQIIVCFDTNIKKYVSCPSTSDQMGCGALFDNNIILPPVMENKKR